MKTILYTFFVILLITSCTHAQKPNSLLRAERILDDAPDSALTILNSARRDFGHYANPYKMEYLLLCAEAINKAYIPMDTIEYMEPVLDYYNKHEKKDGQINANYMLGCVYRDKGNLPEAIHYYENAIKQADTTNNEYNYKLLCSIYGQIAVAYQELRYPAKELSTWRKVRYYAYLAKDTLAAIQSIERSGSAFDLVGKQDSAQACFDMAHKEYLQHGYRQYAAACLICNVKYYLQNHETSKAGKALAIYQKESGIVHGDGSIQKGCEMYFYRLGTYYEQIGDYKSAIDCFHKLLSFPNDIQNIENAYKGLMNVYKSLGINDSIVKYADLYTNTNDSANVLQSATEIIRMQSLYNYSESQKLATQKIRESNFLWKALAMSFVFLFIIASIFTYLLKKHKTERQRTRKEYQKALTKLHLAEEELNSLQQNEENFKRQKAHEISFLQESLSSYKEKYRKIDHMNEHKLLHHDIIKHIQSIAKHGQKLSNSEWFILEDTMKEFITDFYDKMTKNRAALTEQEYRVCLLVKLEFSPSEIANLLGISQQRTTNIRSNINYKLFKQKGAKSLSINITYM